MKPLVVLGLGAVAAACLAVAACGTGSPASPSMQSDASAGDGGGGMTGEGGAAETSTPEASPDADTTPVTVSFAYAPQWSGVTKVEVVGGFGLASDWSKTESLVTLTASGSAYSGTATLPPGTYLYVFRVTGDAQAVPTSTARYSLDPLETAYAPCPAQSPTYDKTEPNPCSQITVTASGGPAPASAVHVTGSLTVDAAPASTWMVVLEREEPTSHHYFVNRVTVGTDGSFDLIGSAGSYRLQVQYPTLLSANDLQRDPLQLPALRRAISAAFPLATTAVAVVTPDLAFHAYPQFAPADGDGGTLPTQFTFDHGTEAKLDVYGGPGDGGVVDIGDPWFTSGTANDGGTVFGGSFNTAQSTEDAAAPATRYMWGTEEPFGVDASVAWTKQTLVFPITWQ